MKHKTAELEGALLDAAVAKALAMRDQRFSSTPDWFPRTAVFDDFYGDEFEPSTRWDHGGPIVQLERIAVVASTGYQDDGPVSWSAAVGAFSHYIDEPLPLSHYGSPEYCGQGPTPLIAAMRAFVASKFGDEVEL